MPRGPKGEKRPADAIGNAIMVAKIATGEIDETATTDHGSIFMPLQAKASPFI